MKKHQHHKRQSASAEIDSDSDSDSKSETKTLKKKGMHSKGMEKLSTSEMEVTSMKTMMKHSGTKAVHTSTLSTKSPEQAMRMSMMDGGTKSSIKAPTESLKMKMKQMKGKGKGKGYEPTLTPTEFPVETSSTPTMEPTVAVTTETPTPLTPSESPTTEVPIDDTMSPTETTVPPTEIVSSPKPTSTPVDPTTDTPTSSGTTLQPTLSPVTTTSPSVATTTTTSTLPEFNITCGECTGCADVLPDFANGVRYVLDESEVTFPQVWVAVCIRVDSYLCSLFSLTVLRIFKLWYTD
jgi:hypothetical protein